MGTSNKAILRAIQAQRDLAKSLPALLENSETTSSEPPETGGSLSSSESETE